MTASASLPLPRWAYLPGGTPVPDGEPLDRAKALVPPAFLNGIPAEHPAFRYAVTLHDRGFFWEAHEVWEAVWKAAPKNGCDRLVLRGFIQLANAGLKLTLGRAQAALRLFHEADHELREALRRRCSAQPGGLAGALRLDALADEVAGRRNALSGGLAPPPALALAPYFDV